MTDKFTSEFFIDKFAEKNGKKFCSHKWDKGFCLEADNGRSYTSLGSDVVYSHLLSFKCEECQLGIRIYYDELFNSISMFYCFKDRKSSFNMLSCSDVLVKELIE